MATPPATAPRPSISKLTRPVAAAALGVDVELTAALVTEEAAELAALETLDAAELAAEETEAAVVEAATAEELVPDAELVADAELEVEESSSLSSPEEVVRTPPVTAVGASESATARAALL